MTRQKTVLLTTWTCLLALVLAAVEKRCWHFVVLVDRRQYSHVLIVESNASRRWEMMQWGCGDAKRYVEEGPVDQWLRES
jgi:hypothetical protein